VFFTDFRTLLGTTLNEGFENMADFDHRWEWH